LPRSPAWDEGEASRESLGLVVQTGHGMDYMYMDSAWETTI